VRRVGDNHKQSYSEFQVGTTPDLESCAKPEWIGTPEQKPVWRRTAVPWDPAETRLTDIACIHQDQDQDQEQEQRS